MLLGALRRSTLHRLPKPFKLAHISLIRMATTLPKLPLFEAIKSHDPNSSVVIHSASGRHFAYGGLLSDVAQACTVLRRDAGNHPLDGERIAFLVENGYDYIGTRHKSLPAERPGLMIISDSSRNLGHQQHRCTAFPLFSCE